MVQIYLQTIHKCYSKMIKKKVGIRLPTNSKLQSTVENIWYSFVVRNSATDRVMSFTI